MARPITADLVLTGYMRGAFPMCEPVTGRIDWFTCDPRALVPLDARFRVPRSLQRTVRGGRFEIRVDTAFDRVGILSKLMGWISIMTIPMPLDLIWLVNRLLC